MTFGAMDIERESPNDIGIMDIERKGEACDGNRKNKTDDRSVITPPQNETYGWSRKDIQKEVEGEIG